METQKILASILSDANGSMKLRHLRAIYLTHTGCTVFKWQRLCQYIKSTEGQFNIIGERMYLLAN